MAVKENPIKKALEDLAEVANSIACHGAGGYTVDTSALDAVFVRSLVTLSRALLMEIDDSEYYDPFGDIYNALPSEV